MNKLEIYKCNECGLVVEVIKGCDCMPACCGKNMLLMPPQTAEFKFEKHVPYPESIEGGTKVSVGKEAAHPMTEEHHIEWIEIVNGPYVNRMYLKPGEKPEALFYVPLKKGMVIREYCNIHGLWEYKVEA